MKIYRACFHDADEGTCVSWHASKREAERALRELQAGRETPQGVEDVARIDLPTDRAGLLSWLNRNLNHDNG